MPESAERSGTGTERDCCRADLAGRGAFSFFGLGFAAERDRGDLADQARRQDSRHLRQVLLAFAAGQTESQARVRPTRRRGRRGALAEGERQRRRTGAGFAVEVDGKGAERFSGGIAAIGREARIGRGRTTCERIGQGSVRAGAQIDDEVAEGYLWVFEHGRRQPAAGGVGADVALETHRHAIAGRLGIDEDAVLVTRLGIIAGGLPHIYASRQGSGWQVWRFDRDRPYLRARGTFDFVGFVLAELGV